VKSELSPHLVILIACFCILAASLILKPASPGTSHLRLGKIYIPNMCILRATTGVPCPGCGLSRSMVAAMHGDFSNSFAYHRLGLLTLVYVFLQFLCRLGIFIIPRRQARLIKYGKFLNKAIIVLAVLFGANWIVTLISLLRHLY
jgi:hypothetical protein